MVTKSKILAAARKKWGKNVELRENRAAPSPAQKEAIRASQRDLVARKKVFEEERKALGDVNKPLLEAARFALDVDGDEPSWSQLREATERAERARSLTEELAGLRTQMDRNAGLLLRGRYELTEDVSVGGLVMRHVRAREETLEGLAASVNEGFLPKEHLP